MCPPGRCGDGEGSCKALMARLAAGHFSIHPDDLDGREMVTTVRTATDGELNVEFKATIHMEMSAFQRLAEKKFKGVLGQFDTKKERLISPWLVLTSRLGRIQNTL